MVKLLVGILKGAVIGAAVGYGAYALELTGGFHWLTYGIVGGLVGLLVGRPLWSLIADKNTTFVIGVLKGLFGFGVGVGLFAIVAKAWGGFQITLGEETRWLHDWQPILGGVIGGLYGGFVELDDSVDEKARAAAKAKAKANKPKPRALPD